MISNEDGWTSCGMKREDDEVVGWENVCVVAVRTLVDDGVGSWWYLVVQRTSGKPSGGASLGTLTATCSPGLVQGRVNCLLEGGLWTVGQVSRGRYVPDTVCRGG